MRPRQWVKSLLVVVAPVAAGKFFHGHVAAKTAVAFVAFCVASSGTYLLNDVRDRSADRLHPGKRTRPIAMGVVPVGRRDRRRRSCCSPSGSGSAFALRWELEWSSPSTSPSPSATRSAPSASRSSSSVSSPSGFVLRAIAGGVATDLPLSPWFLVVISFGALFVVVGKRLAEFHELGAARGVHRAVLDTYTEGFLRVRADPVRRR